MPAKPGQGPRVQPRGLDLIDDQYPRHLRATRLGDPALIPAGIAAGEYQHEVGGARCRHAIVADSPPGLDHEWNGVLSTLIIVEPAVIAGKRTGVGHLETGIGRRPRFAASCQPVLRRRGDPTVVSPFGPAASRSPAARVEDVAAGTCPAARSGRPGSSWGSPNNHGGRTPSRRRQIPAGERFEPKIQLDSVMCSYINGPIICQLWIIRAPLICRPSAERRSSSGTIDHRTPPVAVVVGDQIWITRTAMFINAVERIVMGPSRGRNVGRS